MIPCAMIYILWCVLSPNTILAEELPLYARSALLMDASNGRVLYEENGYKSMPMASTTKIMTCILAIEYMEEQKNEVRQPDIVTVSAYAASMPKVRLGMREGERYYLDNLLYSLMLESHNDTAVAIAEYIDGSVESFAERMNKKARELGCTQTNFITPNGLDKEENGKMHATTARDLGLIASYAIQNETFRQVINTRQYSFQEIDTKRTCQVYNKNRFLDQMEGAIGIKTGFTAGAGYCFVGALEHEGRLLVSVVLGSGWPPNKNWKWFDTQKLMQYGLDHFAPSDIRKQLVYNPLKVRTGVADTVSIYADEKQEQDYTLLLGEEDVVTVTREMPDILQAPVAENTVIGYENYYINGELFKKCAVRTAESVELRTYFYCLRKIFVLYF